MRSFLKNLVGIIRVVRKVRVVRKEERDVESSRSAVYFQNEHHDHLGFTDSFSLLPSTAASQHHTHTHTHTHEIFVLELSLRNAFFFLIVVNSKSLPMPHWNTACMIVCVVNSLRVQVCAVVIALAGVVPTCNAIHWPFSSCFYSSTHCDCHYVMPTRCVYSVIQPHICLSVVCNYKLYFMYGFRTVKCLTLRQKF